MKFIISDNNQKGYLMSNESLKKSIEKFGKWMYKFELAEDVSTPLISEEFQKVHDTRKKMIFSKLDNIIKRWDNLRCLDIACNEGFYSFELAKKGIKEVIGFDAREINIDKANFIKKFMKVENTSFFVEDVEKINDELGDFDLVFVLGLLYHVENPMLILRKIRSLTKGICIIDTQVNRYDSNVDLGFGCTGFDKQTKDIIAIIKENDIEENITASITGLSFIPNKSGLFTMLREVGFTELEQIEPFPNSYEQYATHDRIIIIAK
ncbi:MAG: class I SAM-dependent methyltransferase [Nitrosopumilus sp.]|nr:class I SAM-dependent methyltransferase [Nitrosopumilus sp.]MDH3385540.1 class I SAM-dependent methyltransferase [Nitrosopumilus sp.]